MQNKTFLCKLRVDILHYLYSSHRYLKIISMYTCTYAYVCICIYIIYLYIIFSCYYIEFSILKTKYAEIIACLPGNYEATIGTLQNHFSDSDICDILSLDSGHNQKILNCLILKLKTKEDLLDLSSSLEKIDGTHSSMKRIIKQIRKGDHYHQ